MNITGGKYNSLSIKTADFANIKPTLSKIRQAVFNSLGSLGEFESFCDVFSGSGIMAFEAASRGFSVTAIELDKKSARVIKENIKKIGSNIDFINYDAIKFLAKTDKVFDVFYLDPPYMSDLYNKALSVINNRNLLATNGVIILEKPVSVEVDTTGFELVKEKTYADKVICYYKKS